ncbi:MAG: energy transducer TonB [Dokdonella sp.]|uniref:energy transducer TonB n=1 Tax=Dokdonella sp. TaxID=2291710 RepID=UPI003263C1F3
MLRPTTIVFAIACCGSAFGQSIAPPKTVAPEKLAGYWTMITSSVEANVPNISKGVEKPGCATVSFVVGSDGNTSNVRVQKVVPEGDFRKIAEGMATGLHFEPTVSNAGRQSVMSWLIFPFNLPSDPAAREAVMQACAIDKLDTKAP